MLLAGISANRRDPERVHTGPSVHLSNPVAIFSTVALDSISRSKAGSSFWTSWACPAPVAATSEEIRSASFCVSTHELYTRKRTSIQFAAIKRNRRSQKPYCNTRDSWVRYQIRASSRSLDRPTPGFRLSRLQTYGSNCGADVVETSATKPNRCPSRVHLPVQVFPYLLKRNPEVEWVMTLLFSPDPLPTFFGVVNRNNCPTSG
jgi:hypothetical protein